MNRNHSTSFIIRLLMLVFSMALFGADLVVSAQNSNSSTTTQEDSSVQNDNTSGTNMNRGGRRRRGRRRNTTAMPPNACMPSDTNTSTQENTDTSAEATGNTNTGGRRRRGRNQMNPAKRQLMLPANATLIIDPALRRSQTGRCDPMTQEQTDLSGTYTGRVGYTDVVMAGDATLTINGNSFTLTNGQMTGEGRIVAVTTCNYTAVTMRFGKDVTGAVMNPPPPLPTVSLRAQRTGGGLSLDTVPGESRQFSFHSTGASGSGSGMGGGMPRVRRGGRRGGNKNGSPNPVGIKPPTAM